MKSVISNTSESGCGERAGEAVSGEAAAGREHRGEHDGTGGMSKHSLRCPPPSCAVPAPRARPSGKGRLPHTVPRPRTASRGGVRSSSPRSEGPLFRINS